MKKLPHELFNADIYEWTLKMKPDRVYSVKNIKMDKNKFISHIEYLIACGEPIIFTENMNGLKKTRSFRETVDMWNDIKLKNQSRANPSHSRETIYAKRIKYLSNKNKSLKSYGTQ